MKRIDFTVVPDVPHRIVKLREQLRNFFRCGARKEIREGRVDIFVKDIDGKFRKLSRIEALERYKYE